MEGLLPNEKVGHLSKEEDIAYSWRVLRELGGCHTQTLEHQVSDPGALALTYLEVPTLRRANSQTPGLRHLQTLENQHSDLGVSTFTDLGAVATSQRATHNVVPRCESETQIPTEDTTQRHHHLDQVSNEPETKLGQREI